MDKKLNKAMADILGIISFLEMSEEEQQRVINLAVAERRARTARKNARFAASLARATDIQASRISKLEDEGMTVVKLWTSRVNGRIAVMLQKDGVFDQQTGRIRTKLSMVYHDGRHMTAFGKIPVREDMI